MHAANGTLLVLRTSALELTYNHTAFDVPTTPNTPLLPAGIGAATPSTPPVWFSKTGSLQVRFKNGEETVVWSPAAASTQRTCDVHGQERRTCCTNCTPSQCADKGCCYRDPAATKGEGCDGCEPSCFYASPIAKGNLNGTNDVFDCYDGSKVCTGWYVSRTNQGLVSRDGWAVVDDTAATAIDPTKEPAWEGGQGWQSPRPYGAEYRDWMLMAHGNDYRGALKDFVAVSGPVAMMDVEAYGVWYSKYWRPGIAEADVKAIIAQYRNLSLPLSSFVLDVGWHNEEMKPMAPHCHGYGGYTWNRTLFPDPKAFTSWLHTTAHLKLLVNTHDYIGVDPCQRFYTHMAHELGVDPRTNATLACGWTNSSYTKALYRHALDPRTNGSVSSIDWFWTDYDREPTGYMGSTKPRSGYWFQCPMDDRDASPMLWSSHVHVARASTQGKRGLVLVPYGGLGHHRYPLVGSGDTPAAWSTLQVQVVQTARSANVGVHWTHDLGGFHLDRSHTGPHNRPPGMCSWPELWLRWVQFGVFSPVFRTHCEATCSCQPWTYMVDKVYTAAITRALQLRDALLPYLYTAAHAAACTGVTISHPLYYNHAAVEEAYKHGDQYYFGPDMMVAPVITPGTSGTPGMSGAPGTAGAARSDQGASAAMTTTRSVWLPPGDWVTWQQHHAALLHGPRFLNSTDSAYTLADTPVFVRAGAIVPMRPVYHTL